MKDFCLRNRSICFRCITVNWCNVALEWGNQRDWKTQKSWLLTPLWTQIKLKSLVVKLKWTLFRKWLPLKKQNEFVIVNFCTGMLTAHQKRMLTKCQKIVDHGINCFINRQLVCFTLFHPLLQTYRVDIQLARTILCRQRSYGYRTCGFCWSRKVLLYCIPDVSPTIT